MSPSREIRDVPASVHQRLRNLARDQGVDFNRVLQRYAAERFLYRLSSPEVDRFTLKGAALCWVCAGREQQQIGTDGDGLDRLADAGEEVRRFLEQVCESLIEESPFTQA